MQILELSSIVVSTPDGHAKEGEPKVEQMLHLLLVHPLLLESYRNYYSLFLRYSSHCSCPNDMENSCLMGKNMPVTLLSNCTLVVVTVPDTGISR